MTPETCIHIGEGTEVGKRSIIPVEERFILRGERSIIARVRPIALLICEEQSLFFAPLCEGVTWEGILEELSGSGTDNTDI